jgi:hypothetical protein
MSHRGPDLVQHRHDMTGDPADHVNPDGDRSTLARHLLEVRDQRHKRERLVLHPATEQLLSMAAIGRGRPVKPLSDINPDSYFHCVPLVVVDRVQPLLAGIALRSDRSQCRISDLREPAEQGERPREPSRGPRMKTIPGPLTRSDSDNHRGRQLQGTPA